MILSDGLADDWAEDSCLTKLNWAGVRQFRQMAQKSLGVSFAPSS